MSRAIRNVLGSGRFWPAGLIVFATVFVAANLAFVTMAFRHRPQLVRRDYYEQGYNLRALAERHAAGEAAGWTVKARPLPLDQAAQPLVELAVTGRDGSPADSLAGSAGFYRPSDQRLDIPAAPLTYIGGGRYLVVLPRPLEYGAWQADVRLSRGRDLLDIRVPLFVDK